MVCAFYRLGFSGLAEQGRNLKFSPLLYCVLLLSLVFMRPGFAEQEVPEGLDFIGGYFENGEYKCFAEPCFSLHKQKYPGANNIKFNAKSWPRWLDIDRNCQTEDLQKIVEASAIEVAYADGDECSSVVQGEWTDIYSGEIISDADQITVDYFVSLEEAHLLGGFSWPRNKRALFANLPENLIVVSKQEKEDRAGRAANDWMPSDKTFWCDYIVNRELIFRKFKLKMNRIEDAFNKQIKQLYCKY